MLPMFLGILDQTIVATALPAIAADLGNVELIAWIVVAYLIATGDGCTRIRASGRCVRAPAPADRLARRRHDRQHPVCTRSLD